MKSNGWKILVKALVSAGLLGLLLSNMDLEGVGDSWLHLHPGWLLLCLAVMTLSNILGACQWWLLLKNSGLPIPLGRAISYYYSGLFFNYVLLSFVGGDLLRIYDIAQDSGNRKVAMSTVFLDRLVGMTTLVTLAVIFGLWYSDTMAATGMFFPVLGLFGLMAFIGAFFYFKKFAKHFQAIGDRILPASIVQHLRDFYNSVNYFRAHKSVLLRVGAMSLVTQTLRVMSHFLVAHALLIHHSIPVSLPIFFVFIPVIFIATLLPVSIGGLGIREQAGVLLFAMVGFTAGQAFSMELLTYLLGILAGVPGGIIFILRKQVKVATS